MKKIDYQGIKTNLTHEHSAIVAFLRKHWKVNASPDDLSIMVELTLQDGFNLGSFQQEEVYKERFELLSPSDVSASLTFKPTADPSYEILARFRRDWNVDAKPRGYDRYRARYNQLRPLCVVHPFDGLTEFPVGMAPDFNFPTSLSLGKVAYNDIEQGRSPSVSLQDATFLQGKAYGRMAVWKKYEVLYKAVVGQ